MDCNDEIEKWSGLDMRGKLDGLSKLLEIAENNNEVVSDWASFILTLSGATSSPNPKLVEGCLEVLCAIFKADDCSATSYSKLIIPAISSGFAHIKPNVNVIAIELVMSVAMRASRERSLTSSFMPQLYGMLSHDLWRVRAMTLQSLLNLCEKEGGFEMDESPLKEVSSKDSITKLAACLDDAHATVRQHAMSLTSFLVQTSDNRNKIMSWLQATNVRSTHMVTLRRAVGDMQSSNGSQSNSDKENVSKSSNVNDFTSRASSIKPSGSASLSSSTSSFSTSSSAATIKPLVIDSDGDMNREFSKIEKDLNNSEDWMKRLKALERIQALAMGCCERESFVNGLKSITNLIVAQVKDLRSRFA
jgi:hypothetical protein